MTEDGTLPYGANGTSHHGRHAMAECNATQRNETERKSHQDRAENPSVPDLPQPVDNGHSHRSMRFDEDVFLWCERAGMSAREIAERFGVAERSVVRWRKQMNLSHTPAAEPHSSEDRALARRLLEDGCSFHETAQTVGASDTTVRRWFPDIPAWTKQHASEHAVFVRRMNRTLERKAA